MLIKLGKQMLRLLFSLLFFCSLILQGQTTVDLFIIGGQSNTGAAYTTKVGDLFPVDSSKYLGEKTNIKIINPYWDQSYYQSLYGWTSGIPRWVNLYLGKNTGHLPVPNAAGDPTYKERYGCEVSLGYNYGSCYIYKCGSNSSSIGAYSKPALAFYNVFYTNLYRAFNQAYNSNIKLKLKGFIFIQGETDGISAILSDEFKTDLESVFTQFESSYQFLCTYFNMPDSTTKYKKIILQTRSACTYLDTVELRKEQWVAENSNAIYWRSTSYPFFTDNLHYTGAGYMSMGYDLAAYFRYGTKQTVLKPTVASAIIVTGKPTVVNIVFNHNLLTTSIPATTDFTLTGKTISSVLVKQDTVKLTVTVPYVYGNTVTVNYTKPVSNALTALTGGGKTDSFTNQAVTNNLTSSIPASLTDGNTLGWYIATQAHITEDANGVSAWADTLGVGVSLVQTNNTYKPAHNAGGYVDFAGNRILKGLNAGSLSDPVYVYCVMSIDEAVSAAYFLNFIGLVVRTYDVPSTIWIHNSSATTLPVTIGSFAVYRFQVINTTGVFYNGATSITDVATRLSETFIELGGRLGAGQFVDCKFKELIVRKIADGATEEAEIYNYLKTKYGL